MNTNIAIHLRENSFSDRWIIYCKENSIPHKIVNCFDNDIISQLADVQGLLWHWSLNSPAEIFATNKILHAVETTGIKVFPNNKTCWHYDDNIVYYSSNISKFYVY